MRPPNYYAHPGFERAGLKRREPEWIRERAADAASQFVPVWRSQNLVTDIAGSGPRAIVLTADHVALLLEGDHQEHLTHGRLVFLGIGQASAGLSRRRPQHLDACHAVILSPRLSARRANRDAEA